MNSKRRTKLERELIAAFRLLETEDEFYAFLRDLLSEAEFLEIGRRWQAARLLDRRVSYPEIISQTGLSSTTIARISKWLKSGMGGYRLVLDRGGAR
jgi:TrpR-related protein YerC/YecD